MSAPQLVSFASSGCRSLVRSIRAGQQNAEDHFVECCLSSEPAISDVNMGLSSTLRSVRLSVILFVAMSQSIGVGTENDLDCRMYLVPLSSFSFIQ